MTQEDQGQFYTGYGPTSSGRPVAMVPYGSNPPMEVDTNPPLAMGDHQLQPQISSVTVQQTQMRIAGYDLPNAVAMVPNTTMAVRSPEKEPHAKRRRLFADANRPDKDLCAKLQR